MNDWTDPIHHVFVEVHEVSDRVGVGLHRHVLDEPLERHLPIEFCDGDGGFGCALVLVLVLLGGGVASVGGGVLFGGGAGRK